MNKFTTLGLPKYICSVLSQIGFIEPTEIQNKAIPVVRAGHDVLASAHTGSGKTASFALPIIEYIDMARALDAKHSAEQGKPCPIKTRALVLVPTRELAIQVAEEFDRFSKNFPLKVATIYGGSSFGTQLRAIKKGCHVIVATPGRLLDHLERKTVNLTNIEKFVMDEADRLMDMGFMPQIRRIVGQIPKKRQTIMFSATINRRIEEIAAEYLVEPTLVKANSGQVEPKEIEQHLINVDEFDKDDLLLKLLNKGDMETVLIFTETRRKATWVKDRLRDAKVMAEELHSDIPQSQREKTLSRYREGKFTVLVATDVAARGLDIPAISHVVNYDLPNSSEDYVHRIGRTGRAGRKGVAVSFVSQEQKHLLKDIEKMTGKQMDNTAVKRPLPANAIKPPSGRTFRPRNSSSRAG
ncbi:MAG: DEAD/DEAH box helicase [Candidatus Obscuribacterales bacterium]|nr:DEAD/DEAH box helicase [Candidatus Obscuribacterales bacterium]